jgi:alpha-glucosidase
MADGARWWQDGVLYQVYPRSFQDADGDGMGDLDGVTMRLDHLAWLGVEAIWLNPIHPSPNRDWGYDVADYLDVAPELGGLPSLDRLIEQAGHRGIGVILDLVPNHTSDRHPWFLDALSGRDAEHRSGTSGRIPRPTEGHRTTGGARSAGRRGRSMPRRGSITCTTSCHSSRT